MGAKDDVVKSLLGGRDLTEVLVRSMADKFERSWGMQDAGERCRRLDYVLRMAVELARVRETVQASSSLAAWAIEAVITGDTGDIKRLGVEWLSEASLIDNYGDEERGKQLAGAYAAFREIAEEAYFSALPKEKV